MSDYNLKPCPFCGSKNVHAITEFWPRSVSCNDCGGKMNGAMYGFGDEATKKTIAAWNRRTGKNRKAVWNRWSGMNRKE